MRSPDDNIWFMVTTPPEKVRGEKEKARALRKTQWWQRQIAKGLCYYCGRPTPPGDLTMDHIVPLIRGGRSTRGNVAPACKSCNNRKKYMLPIEWDEYLKNLATRGRAEGCPNASESGEVDDGKM